MPEQINVRISENVKKNALSEVEADSGTGWAEDPRLNIGTGEMSTLVRTSDAQFLYPCLKNCSLIPSRTAKFVSRPMIQSVSLEWKSKELGFRNDI